VPFFSFSLQLYEDLMCELLVHLERPLEEFITYIAFTKFGFLLPLIFGVSVSEVFRMVSLVLGYISETREPPVSREKLIETAIVFLDWLKQVFRGLPHLSFFSYLKPLTWSSSSKII